MRADIAVLKSLVAKVHANMANRPTHQRRLPADLVRQAVAEEVAARSGHHQELAVRSGIPAEHVRETDDLLRIHGMTPLWKLDLALAIEARLGLAEALAGSSDWRTVADVVRDALRQPAARGGE